MDSITSSRWAARNEARATRARARNTLPSIVTEYTWMETSAENQGPRVVSATARARIATRPKRATKTKFIVADRRDRPTPPGALAQARYLIRAGRSCRASSRHRRQERHYQRGELRVRDGQPHDPSGPRECESRLQRHVTIQRDRRGQTHDLVHVQRHPGRRPELDPALNVPDQLHGPLEGPVPPLQGRRRLECVPGTPPLRAGNVSALACFTRLRIPPQFGGRSGPTGDLARPPCGRPPPDRADTRPQWGLEVELRPKPARAPRTPWDRTRRRTRGIGGSAVDAARAPPRSGRRRGRSCARSRCIAPARPRRRGRTPHRARPGRAPSTGGCCPGYGHRSRPRPREVGRARRLPGWKRLRSPARLEASRTARRGCRLPRLPRRSRRSPHVSASMHRRLLGGRSIPSSVRPRPPGG